MLRGFVVTVAYAGGKYKMVAQVRDVFEKQNIVPKRNVIEEYQVLVQLPHIADMGHYRISQLLCQETYGKKFAHPPQPGTIRLNVVQRARLHEILKHD